MIDARERALLEESVRAAIARASARGEGTASADAALEELGWRAMLADEPREAVDVVFRALGEGDASATALDDVVAAALGAEPCADLAVLLPPFGAWDSPGRSGAKALSARGLATARASSARELLIVCAGAEGLSSVRVPIAAVHVRPVHGIDPRAGLCAVSVETSVETSTSTSRFVVARLLDTAWEAAVAAARRALASQTLGASRAMLALARTHALERTQFGRPIARFQAVRHKLAEALVAVEALEAAVSVAGEEGGSETAALAKAVAGRTARTVATHCQQVLAGIGFTTEHPFHRFLERTMLLEGLFGAADEIVRDLGHRLLASREVKALVEL